MKNLQNFDEEEDDITQFRNSYKKQISFVSKKIEKWHKKISQRIDSSFQHDHEFFKLEHSPSRFNRQDHSDTLSSVSSRANEYEIEEISQRSTADQETKRDETNKNQSNLNSRNFARPNLRRAKSSKKRTFNKMDSVNEATFQMKINPIQEAEEDLHNQSAIHNKHSIDIIKRAQSKKESDRELKIRPISEIKQFRNKAERLNDSNLYSGVPSPLNDKKRKQKMNFQRPKNSALQESSDKIQLKKEKVKTDLVTQKLNFKNIVDSPQKQHNQNLNHSHRKLKNKKEVGQEQSFSRTASRGFTFKNASQEKQVPQSGSTFKAQLQQQNKFSGLFKTNFLKSQLPDSSQFIQQQAAIKEEKEAKKKGRKYKSKNKKSVAHSLANYHHQQQLQQEQIKEMKELHLSKSQTGMAKKHRRISIMPIKQNAPPSQNNFQQQQRQQMHYLQSKSFERAILQNDIQKMAQAFIPTLYGKAVQSQEIQENLLPQDSKLRQKRNQQTSIDSQENVVRQPSQFSAYHSFDPNEPKAHAQPSYQSFTIPTVQPMDNNSNGGVMNSEFFYKRNLPDDKEFLVDLSPQQQHQRQQQKQRRQRAQTDQEFTNSIKELKEGEQPVMDLRKHIRHHSRVALKNAQHRRQYEDVRGSGQNSSRLSRGNSQGDALQSFVKGRQIALTTDKQ